MHVYLIIKNELSCFLSLDYELWFIFWGNSLHSSTIFRMQRKVVRIMERCGNRVSCRNFEEITNFAFDIKMSMIFINVCSSKQKPLLNKR
jgi:hypothetical protein